jgi:hypothetical protein
VNLAQDQGNAGFIEFWGSQIKMKFIFSQKKQQKQKEGVEIELFVTKQKPILFITQL